MRTFLILLVAGIVSAELVEFYDIDSRRADPCVNQQRLNGLVSRHDCTYNSELPPPATTFLVPSSASPTGRLATNYFLASVTITGRFFPTGSTQIALSKGTSFEGGEDSCAPGNIDSPGTVLGLPPPPIITQATSTATKIIFTLPTAWTTTYLDLEDRPRKICWRATTGTANDEQYQWTGLRIGVTWNCDDGSDDTKQHCANQPAYTKNHDQLDQSIRKARNVCCSNKAQTKMTTGQCINPNVESCCGSAAVAPQMKCCNATIENVGWADGICYCTQKTDCGNAESCCLPTKYSELTSATPVWGSDIGQCYNPMSHRCCDTGMRYDPGSDQCCTINGVQSVNVPCPCHDDTHCKGSQMGFKHVDFACCKQTAPAPQEINTIRTAASTCNKYQNYPTGNGDYANQQCLGQCIDTKYQVCCNGRACIREFESCCNSTCCNRYFGTCKTGVTRAQSQSAFNWVEYDVPYDVCSTVEQIDVIKAWWMFVLPCFLLVGTLIILAVALVFAGRVESQARRGLEKMMIAAAVLAILFIIPTYFTPAYKYGVIVVLAALFAIVASAARNEYIYIVCIVVQGLTLFYLFDPFHGNNYFNLAMDRTDSGNASPNAAGLWQTTSRAWDMPETCVAFYNGYFQGDDTLGDTVRSEEPNVNTFGYCSRGWISAVLIFGGFAIIAVLIQFILDILALLLRGSALRKAAEVKWD